MSTETRYQRLALSLQDECKQAGRNPEEVTLLAVSKTVDIDEVACAISAGARAFGENRPDELVRKQAAFPEVEWHFIGNIQSRRIPDIVKSATLIHSVAKEEHLEKINRAAQECNKVQQVLIEVNVSGEQSKSGFEPADVWPLICRNAALPCVDIVGLMTMAPQGDIEAIQETFAGLAALQNELQEKAREQALDVAIRELSMGMTEDWPYAIPYGATIIRVGRAIFDEAFE